MLKSMSVKNFAIIDNIQIDYKNNMSVLTGETGAGKSLIIDAIGLLFGDRASSELVRHGENKATIEGIFENQEDTNLFLNDNDIDIEDYLVIKREIYENGKSICKINGEAVSLNLLSELGVMLGNIHTQFDNEKLTDPKNYFDFIDTSEVKDLLIKYQIILKEYNQKNKEYNKLLLDEEENKQKLDYLKYQYAELKKANLSINEEEDLKNQAQILNNYEKISSNVEEFLSKENALDEIYDSISSLENVAKYDDDFASLKESLMEAYYNINDIFEEVKNKYSKNDVDLNELNNINDRLSVYSDLKRKYKKTTEEIIEFYESLKDKIDSIENFDVLSKDLKKEVDKLHSEVLSLALRISELRKTSSKQIEKEIITNLNDLQLNNTILEIKIESNENNFKRNGIDEVLINITFNKGEELKPLHKVASGGELSRFMLALKAISSKKFVNKTLIFDEIDSGVSGAVAYSIANKIKEISKYAQVLCVTHLVQVAASADHQLFISKSLVDDRTVTDIKELTYDERVIEISKMASFGDTSNASIDFAKELLNK